MNRNEIVFTPQEYAQDMCYGKVTCQTVRNWTKKWMSEGGLPENHQLKLTPSGRVLIIVKKVNPKKNQLLDLLIAGKH